METFLEDEESEDDLPLAVRTRMRIARAIASDEGEDANISVGESEQQERQAGASCLKGETNIFLEVSLRSLTLTIAHEGAVKILHRDISIGNVMTTNNDKELRIVVESVSIAISRRPSSKTMHCKLITRRRIPDSFPRPFMAGDLDRD
jgi:hypothetical protein